MKRKSTWIVTFAALLCCYMSGAAYGVSSGEKIKVKGVITEHNGENITLRTPNSGDMVVVLTDDTKVERPKPPLKIRKEHYGQATLTPGLRIEVKGVGDDQGRVVAGTIKFSKESLQTAEAIQGGLVPTNKQVEANKEAIAAINNRLSALSGWETKATTTVYYPNGTADLSKKSEEDLVKLANKAMSLNGYIVEVKGYASSPGTAEENQKLSMDRAQGVIQYLQESCKVPVKHIMAPVAFGESHPVASNTTPNGQAENRRVEVAVLINKELQGGSPTPSH